MGQPSVVLAWRLGHGVGGCGGAPAKPLLSPLALGRFVASWFVLPLQKWTIDLAMVSVIAPFEDSG